MGCCCITLGARQGTLWQPREMGWDGEWWEVQEGGNISILMTDSCCMAEAKTIL